MTGIDQIATEGLTPRQIYYARNREKVIARQRAYYHKNALKVRERRVQSYRSKTISTMIGDNSASIVKKSAVYLERHREYYEKNKETIRERRRTYYHVKKEALARRVGKFEFAKISAVRNLAEIPDPFEAYGKINISIPPPLPPVKALNQVIF